MESQPSRLGPGPGWPSADHRHSQQKECPVSYGIRGKSNRQSKPPGSGVVCDAVESNQNICPPHTGSHSGQAPGSDGGPTGMGTSGTMIAEGQDTGAH